MTSHYTQRQNVCSGKAGLQSQLTPVDMPLLSCGRHFQHLESRTVKMIQEKLPRLFKATKIVATL